jgi:CheY-like chemotaxis protein
VTTNEGTGAVEVDPNRPALLLVDDVKANLIALEAILSNMGCDLVLSHSGNDALSQLLRREFAAVVLDAHMPGMDGFEVARYARQNPTTKDVPILFLTAMHPSEESALKGYGSGAVDFLFKPVNPLVLRSKVQVFVELFVARKQLVAAKIQALELESTRRMAEARRALLKELFEKNAALERARVELEQFAFVAAHDLREPMRIISLHTDILDRKHADQLSERGRRGGPRRPRHRASRRPDRCAARRRAVR